MTKKITIIVLLIIIVSGVFLVKPLLPIISAYGAKNLCSCAFISNRTETSILSQELANFPRNIGTFKLNISDSSATGSVLGFAERKAVFKKGVGCTLVLGKSEAEIRSVHYSKSVPRGLDTIPWPNGDYILDSLPSGIDINQVKKIVNQAFEETDLDHPQNTRGVVVVYDGQLVYEQYAEEFNKNMPQLGWSMNKSITSTLIGMLVHEGVLNIYDPAPVPEWSDQNDARHKITIDHLLRMSSGLDWEENYGKVSNATTMLFNSADIGAYAANIDVGYPPDTKWYYSSGTSNILARIVRDKVGKDQAISYPHTALFEKIAMHSAVLEADPSNTYVASSYGYATPRDWARFGLLYYNDGIWNGERLLPEGWVEYSSTRTTTDSTGRYGAHFWLNAGQINNTADRWLPDVPTDTYMANGFEGQRVIIIPSKKLVLVRMGLTARGDFDFNKFISGIINATE